MGGLVQKPVTAPVIPIPVPASDWPAELLSFWLARASPAAATMGAAAEIDGKVHHAPLVLAIFWVIIYSSVVNLRARFRYHHDIRETAIKPYLLNCSAKYTKCMFPCKKVAGLWLPPAENSNVNHSSFLPNFLSSLWINLSFGLQGRPTQHATVEGCKSSVIGSTLDI